MLWLKAGTTNNNPRVIAYYFMEYITKFGGKQIYPGDVLYKFYFVCGLQDLVVLHHVLGVPRILRTDCGTENTNLAFIQPYLRRSHGDCFSGTESFRYGRSVSNQVCHNRIFKNDIFIIIILYLA